MNQGRNRRSDRPRVTKAPPLWKQEEDKWAAYRPETVQQPAAPERQQPSVEPVQQDHDMSLRLVCTLCAMCGLFGAFLCWAEKENLCIRSYAVQSAALTGMHAVAVIALVLVHAVLAGVPYLGVVMSLVGWIAYMAAAVMLLILRVRMMRCAWQGKRYRLPVGNAIIRRYAAQDMIQENHTWY